MCHGVCGLSPVAYLISRKDFVLKKAERGVIISGFRKRVQSTLLVYSVSEHSSHGIRDYFLLIFHRILF